MHLTALELAVLERIVSGEDPWLGGGAANGSRKISQALQRLKRKGAIQKPSEWGPEPYAATVEGKAYLAGKISEAAP
jgi:hypothetical protein